MPKFPADMIQVTTARYSAHWGPLGLASISVGLAPFAFDGEMHETSLRCDQIDLDLDDFRSVAGKSFEFPNNPEPGYIDSTIYLFGIHVYVFTKRLSFGAMGEETIPLKIEATLEFGASGLSQYADAALSLETSLYLPLTAARLVAIAEGAIGKAAAQSPRDLGKVMALLTKDPRTDGRMAELNAEVRRILQARAAS